MNQRGLWIIKRETNPDPPSRNGSQTGTTVIIVTHNASLAPIADRVIRMHDAKIKSVELNPNPQKIEDLEY